MSPSKAKRKEIVKNKRQAQAARALAKKEKTAEELAELEEEMEAAEIESEGVEEPGEDETEEEAEDESVEEPQQEEKDYGYSDLPTEVVQMMDAPTSFDELDQIRLERERADALNDTTYDVRRLVGNILADPTLDLTEKADAIRRVGGDFADRAQQILGAETTDEIDAVIEKEKTDLDLLALQALIARDQRHTTVVDTLKAMVSYGSRQSMPDSNFALVTEYKGKKIRRYLIHDASHVRNALARAAQVIKRGAEPFAGWARAALPKIHAAAKKMGIGAADKKKERSAILVEKDAKGQWRWVGYVSNNFQDWDGDIFCEAAHKEYVDWWEKNQDVSPAFVTWHTKGTARKSPVDFVTYEKGFLIMSGPLEEHEAAALLKAQKLTDLGMSHGTLIFSRDPKDPRVVTKYRMYEVSDLPLENAANPFTDFETVVKEVGMDKTKYLAAILGSEEKAKTFLEKVGLKQKDLEAAGVAHKEKAEEKPPAEPVAQPPATTVVNNAPANTEAVLQEVMKQLDVDGLNAFVLKAQEAIEKVPVLEELVKSQQTSVDQQLAERISPPAARRFAWSIKEVRPSTSSANIVEKNDALATAAPGVPEDYWLSKATNTEPVEVPAK